MLNLYKVYVYSIMLNFETQSTLRELWKKIEIQLKGKIRVCGTAMLDEMDNKTFG